jgi:hypothetical protein
VAELTRGGHPYRTLVVDTADAAEKLIATAVCQAQGKASIEDFGYGKGYVLMAETWRRFLDTLTRLQTATGMHVLFLGHAQMRKFEQPDEAGAYDRWELKLLKQSPGILKEWADLVLFANYKTLVVEIDGRKKAQGGQRVMYSEHHPCWDAKNRFGLPAEMPLAFTPLAGLFTAPARAAAPAPATPAPATPAPATAPAAGPNDAERAKLLGQLCDLLATGAVTVAQLGAELARKGVVPADTPVEAYNLPTLRRVIAGWTAICTNIRNQEKKA